jgi:hypothetical protein
MKTNLISHRNTWYFAAAALVLAGHFLGLRPRLGAQASAQIEGIALLGLLLALVGALLFLPVTLLALVFTKNRAGWLNRLRGQMIFLLIVVLLLAVIVAASQWMAYTPPIWARMASPCRAASRH